MAIAPLGDRVLVRRDPPNERVGLIWLAGSRRSALERRSLDGNPATVLAVGPGKWVTHLPSGKKIPKPYFQSTDHVKPGDRVLLGFHPGVALPREFGPELFFKGADEIGTLIIEEDADDNRPRIK